MTTMRRWGLAPGLWLALATGAFSVQAANQDLPSVLGEHMPSLEQLCKSLPANASDAAENSPARSIAASCAAIQPLATAGSGKIIWEDYPPLIKARQSIGALSAEAVFGDHVDRYSGALSFSAQDVDIPGNFDLPVSVARKFTVSHRKDYVAARDYAFADWDLDLPRLSGTFATTWHDNRCSVAAPPTVQTVIAGTDYWHGNMADMPGGGEMLRADVSRPMPTTGGPYQWLTSGDTYFSCLSSILNGTGEGFLAITKEGKKYWFNQMAQYVEPWVSKPISGTNQISTARRKNVLYPSRIEDRFGNWVSFSYSNAYNQPVRLNQISSSDGRTLTLQYNASGYISQVSDGSRTWTYSYNGDTLTQVTRPDGSSWSIDFNQLSHAEITINHSDDISRICTTPPDIISGEVSGSITSPSGAVGTFTVAPQLIGRTNVPLVCTNWTTPGAPNDNPSIQYSVLPVRWASLTLTRKQLSGAGLASKTWAYTVSSNSSYKYPAGQTTPVCTNASCLAPQCLSDSCAGVRTSTVTEPDGVLRTFRFGSSYQYNEGKLLTETVTSPTGTVLKTVQHGYNYATSGQPYAAKIGSSPQIRGDGFTSEYPRPEVLSTTTQQGSNFVWAVPSTCSSGVLCMDTLMRPTRVNLSSTASGSPSRLEDLAYFDQPALWVMGQLASRSVAGALAEETSYDSATALPLTDKSFGVVKQTRGWDLSSSVASGQRGTLRTLADGKNNTTTLSDWFRGVPRAVLRADSTTESAVVSAEGWITQFTDPNGLSTSYSYDSLGRMTGLTPPGGFASTGYVFEAVPYAEFDLAAGHWRQTTSKGAARSISYYDALWRPVMSRSFDANNEAETRKVQIKAYDHGGRPTFESYAQRDITGVTASVAGRRTQYDGLGRPTREESDTELGVQASTIDYLTGFQVRRTNPRGYATTQTLWALDKPDAAQLGAISAPEGVTVNIARDVHGKPTSIARGGVTRRYVYDAGQRLCKTIDPESGATIQDYDAAGNLAWRAPGTALTSASSCDTASVPAAAKISHGYTALNLLQSTSYGDGSPGITRTYWPDGKLKTIGTGSGDLWSYSYNALRLLTGETLSYAGQSYSLAWSYDGNGNLSSLSYPTGGPVVTYLPNALGEPRSVGSYASGVKFHPNGAVSNYTLGNAIAHSLTQNLRGLPLVNEDVGVMKDAYSYDANGNVTAIADQREGIFGRSMSYDGLDRLTAANAPSVWGNASYSYDAADNLRTAVVGVRNSTLNYDAASNRLSSVVTNGGTTLYGYDALGNIRSKGAQTFTFDIGNRLTASSLGGGYVYDGHGRRIKVISSDGSTRIQVYSQRGQLLWAASTGGPRPASSTAYVHLDGKQIAETSNGVTQYVHADALGSPVAHTSSSGAILNRTRFEAYGYVAAGTKPNAGTSVIGFTGHVQDAETDLVYMQQRYYDPIAGRFLSVDPIVTDANTGKGFGLYTYVDNNPYAKVDPDGRSPMAFVGMSLSSQSFGMLVWTGSASSSEANQRIASAVSQQVGQVTNTLKNGALVGAMLLQKGARTIAAAVGAEGANSEEGCIYCVSGDKTSSGKDYVGSTDNMGNRQRDKSDGRDREGAEVVDTYPKGDRDARRAKEQQAMNDRGGVDKLDNKRNEVAPKKWPSMGVTPP